MIINNFQITISDISANDYILFEEKKIDPNSNLATSKSIGYNDAILWLFSNFYFHNDERITRDFLDRNNFESHHVLNMLDELVRVKGDITILDNAENYEESNHFKYKKFEIERIKIPWSDTYKFTKNIQHKRETNSSMELNKNFLKKYFRINGNSLTEQSFTDGKLLPVDLFLLLTIRLGKLLRA